MPDTPQIDLFSKILFYWIWTVLVSSISIHSHTQAQTVGEVRLSALVLDNNTGRPIESAIVVLKNNQHVGGITDSSGHVKFNIPEVFDTDTLLISFIGYDQLKVPISELTTNEDPITFRLNQTSTVLREVIVRDHSFRLGRLFATALSKIPKNYPNKRHQLQGLFRQVSTENNIYTYLEEAVVTIEDYKYGQETHQDKIKLQSVRRSKEFGNVDSTVVRALNRSWQAIGQGMSMVSRNHFYWLYENIFIRHFRDDHTRFYFKMSKKFIDKNYRFELMDSYVNSDSDTILHIAYGSSKYSRKLRGGRYV